MLILTAGTDWHWWCSSKLQTRVILTLLTVCALQDTSCAMSNITSVSLNLSSAVPEAPFLAESSSWLCDAVSIGAAYVEPLGIGLLAANDPEDRSFISIISAFT